MDALYDIRCQELVDAIFGTSRKPEVAYPPPDQLMRMIVQPTRSEGEGYSVTGLTKEIRYHVQEGKEPARILRYFTNLGLPEEAVRRVLRQSFGVVIP